jgi:putative phosphoesterase
MRIGILSDTHTGRPLDEMGPGPAEFLSSVDLILHTGDVTGPDVLDWLETLGPPMVCTRGNHDLFDDDRFEEVFIMEHEGWRIGASHIVLDPRSDPNRIELMKRRGYHDTSLDILIAGDTHYERIEYVDRTLLLNSGSLMLPRNQTVRLGSVALLDVTRDHVHAEIIPLGETEGLTNPARPASIDFDREKVLQSSFKGEVIVPEDGVVAWPWPAPRDQM